jgi:predicted transcriptional regulator
MASVRTASINGGKDSQFDAAGSNRSWIIGSSNFESIHDQILRRSQLEIRMDMLKAVREGAEGPTQIMYRANLSWINLQMHLKILVVNGLLAPVEIGNRKRYELTTKGLNVMNRYLNLLDEVNQQEEELLILEQKTH